MYDDMMIRWYDWYDWLMIHPASDRVSDRVIASQPVNQTYKQTDIQMSASPLLGQTFEYLNLLQLNPHF